jgi:hypothetical protein
MFVTLWRRNEREHNVLLLFASVSAWWLVWMLFFPEVNSIEAHVWHECVFAFLTVLYVATQVRIGAEALVAVTVIGLAAPFVPLPIHTAYSGLIALDAATLCVLMAQRELRDKVHAAATTYFTLVMAAQCAQHILWEFSNTMARFAGRFSAVLYFLGMLMIARAALDGPGPSAASGASPYCPGPVPQP